MKFSIDGQEFNVIVTELARKGRVSESKLSGDVKSGAHFRDIIGTYYDYEMTVGSNALSETEYDALFEILTAPVESHASLWSGYIELPGVHRGYERQHDGR